METPGELYDKLSILKIRESRHPDPEARVNIQRQIEVQELELRLLKASVKGGLWPVEMLRMPKFKLRARKAVQPSALSLDHLASALAVTNEAMWNNEDVRDRLVTEGAGDAILIEADRKEQQLNQNRNALIDAINEAAINEWAPK